MSQTDSDRSDQDPANPNADNSGQDGAQPNSQGDDLRDTISAILDEVLPGKLQSQKDRRINKLEKQAGATQDRLGRIEELIESGMSFQDARARVDQEDRNDAIDRFLQAQLSQEQEQGNSSNVSGVVQSIFEAHGISKSDPRVAQFLSENAGDDAIQKAALLATEIKSTPVSPVNVQSLEVGSPQYKTLQQQYEDDKAKVLKQYGRGSDALIRLKIEYRKKGLDIY